MIRTIFCQMSLFTSSSRATVAYLLAFFVLLGLPSHNHGVLAAMSDASVTSARNIAQDNAEFSWDKVRIRVDCKLFDCISTVDSTIAFACKKTWLAQMFSGTSMRSSYSMCIIASSRIIQLIVLGPSRLFRPTGCRSCHRSHSETINIGWVVSGIQRTYSLQPRRSGRKRHRIYTSRRRFTELNYWTAIRYS